MIGPPEQELPARQHHHLSSPLLCSALLQQQEEETRTWEVNLFLLFLFFFLSPSRPPQTSPHSLADRSLSISLERIRAWRWMDVGFSPLNYRTGVKAGSLKKKKKGCTLYLLFMGTAGDAGGGISKPRKLARTIITQQNRKESSAGKAARKTCEVQNRKLRCCIKSLLMWSHLWVHANIL